MCFTELVVWINPLIAVSLKTRLLEGYCKCMCPLGTAFLMPPGWRLHRLGPAIAACSYIYYYYSSSPNLIAFRGPKHARKVRKLCTRIRTGENLRLIWVSGVGVAKWLDSATYKYSAECASSYVSRTCTKIGTLM